MVHTRVIADLSSSNMLYSIIDSDDAKGHDKIILNAGNGRRGTGMLSKAQK